MFEWPGQGKPSRRQSKILVRNILKSVYLNVVTVYMIYFPARSPIWISAPAHNIHVLPQKALCPTFWWVKGLMLSHFHDNHLRAPKTKRLFFCLQVMYSGIPKQRCMYPSSIGFPEPNDHCQWGQLEAPDTGKPIFGDQGSGRIIGVMGMQSLLYSCDLGQNS